MLDGRDSIPVVWLGQTGSTVLRVPDPSPLEPSPNSRAASQLLMALHQTGGVIILVHPLIQAASSLQLFPRHSIPNIRRF